MKIRTILIVVLSGMLLFGCATSISYLRKGATLVSTDGYIAGRFQEEWGFLQLFPSISALIKETTTGDVYRFDFTFGPDIQLLDVPPGEYILVGVYGKVTTRDGNFTYENTVNIILPDVLLDPFRVSSGGVTYIGDSKIKKVFFVGYQYEYAFDRVKAKADLEKSYKGMENMDFTVILQ